MIAMLVDQGYLDADFAEHREEHEADIIDALYRALKGSPCKLLAASITDAVGEKRAQNQPGTNNEYPNWRIPLADDKAMWCRSKPSSTPPVPNVSPKSSITDSLQPPPLMRGLLAKRGGGETT